MQPFFYLIYDAFGSFGAGIGRREHLHALARLVWFPLVVSSSLWGRASLERAFCVSLCGSHRKSCCDIPPNLS